MGRCWGKRVRLDASGLQQQLSKISIGIDDVSVQNQSHDSGRISSQTTMVRLQYMTLTRSPCRQTMRMLDVTTDSYNNDWPVTITDDTVATTKSQL
jgi:hypothetical protein